MEVFQKVRAALASADFCFCFCFCFSFLLLLPHPAARQGWFTELSPDDEMWPGQAMSLEVRPSPLAPRARSAPRPAHHVAHVERCGRSLLISCAPAADRGDAAG